MRLTNAGVRTDLYQAVDELTLRAAIQSCRELQRLEERGFVDELRARYTHLKRYLPTFLTLPLVAAPGLQPLLTALDLARRLHAGDLKTLPADAPLQFVPAAWRRALWREERHEAYVRLYLPSEADQALDRPHTAFAQVATEASRGLAQNPFATIVDGRLHLKRRDALEVSERVRALRRVIETHLPRARIEELLRETDAWCHFNRILQPLVGAPPLAARFYPTLLAAAAHGTNLSTALMGESRQGITVDMLHEVSHACLRTETLKATNKALVGYHHRLALSVVWGDGTVSSSDRQRFGIEARSLLASLYPLYFGYYDRAISCTPREALYVLDGLLDNDMILRTPL